MNERTKFEDLRHPKYRRFMLEKYLEALYEGIDNNAKRKDEFVGFLEEKLKLFKENKKKAMDPKSINYGSDGLILSINGVERVGDKIEVTSSFYKKENGRFYKPKYY